MVTDSLVILQDATSKNGEKKSMVTDSLVILLFARHCPKKWREKINGSTTNVTGSGRRTTVRMAHAP